MNKRLLIFLVLLLTVGTLYFLNEQTRTQNQKTNNDNLTPQNASVTVTPSFTEMKTCMQNDVHASISFEGAAGSVNGSAFIENTSQEPCRIQTNSFITAHYQSDKENIQVTNIGTPSQTFLDLQPLQKINTSIKFPNGPQCSQVTQTQVRFTYDIGAAEITFEDTDKKTSFMLQTCISNQEVTTITISPFTGNK